MDNTADQNRIVMETIRRSRDITLEAAIEICRDLGKMGCNANDCAMALQHLAEQLPPPPGSMS